MKPRNSSDSGDSIPVCIVKTEDYNSYASLHQPTLEHCEFCDQIFSTRFANIKHSATHIIIPLIKLSLHQCDECLFNFCSLQELHAHITAKNHETSQFPENYQNSISNYQEILKSIVEKQVVVACHDTLSEVLNPEVYLNGTNPKGCKLRTSPALSPKELNSNIADNNNITSEVETIPIFEISSDSDRDSPDRECNPGREQSKPRKEQNVPSKKQSISERGQSVPSKEQSISERGQSVPREEQSISERGQSVPREEQSISESGQSVPREEQSISESGLSVTREEQTTLGRGQGVSDEKHVKSKESSPFNYNSSKELSSPNYARDLSSPIEPIRSRIMFEDDFEDDDLFEAEEILPDKPYQPEQNLVILGNNSNKSNNTSLMLNSGTIGSQCNNNLFKPLNGELNETVDAETEGPTKSIHFEELLERDICDCRYCGQCFNNKYELIKHESTHMRARRTRPVLCSECERYIAGNYRSLRKHMEKKHPTQHQRKMQIQRCNVCLLQYYNYSRHVKYYHETCCKFCNRCFDRQQFYSHDCKQSYNRCKTCNKIFDQLVNHVCEPDLAVDTHKVIKMCEICLAFAKNRQNIHYEVIKEHSEVGIRQLCDRCNNKYFEVYLVDRKVKCREGPDLWKRKKPMSNQERLKKMQNRLKMVNKRNKC